MQQDYHWQFFSWAIDLLLHIGDDCRYDIMSSFVRIRFKNNSQMRIRPPQAMRMKAGKGFDLDVTSPPKHNASVLPLLHTSGLHNAKDELFHLVLGGRCHILDHASIYIKSRHGVSQQGLRGITQNLYPVLQQSAGSFAMSLMNDRYCLMSHLASGRWSINFKPNTQEAGKTLMFDIPDCTSVCAKLISVFPEWPNDFSHPESPLLVGLSAHDWQVRARKCAGESSFSCWLSVTIQYSSSYT